MLNNGGLTITQDTTTAYSATSFQSYPSINLQGVNTTNDYVGIRFSHAGNTEAAFGTIKGANNGETLLKLIDTGHIKSIHDVSIGGIITAVSKMCIKGNKGISINKPKFGELTKKAGLLAKEAVKQSDTHIKIAMVGKYIELTDAYKSLNQAYAVEDYPPFTSHYLPHNPNFNQQYIGQQYGEEKLEGQIYVQSSANNGDTEKLENDYRLKF